MPIGRHKTAIILTSRDEEDSLRLLELEFLLLGHKVDLHLSTRPRHLLSILSFLIGHGSIFRILNGYWWNLSIYSAVSRRLRDKWANCELAMLLMGSDSMLKMAQQLFKIFRATGRTRTAVVVVSLACEAVIFVVHLILRVFSFLPYYY